MRYLFSHLRRQWRTYVLGSLALILVNLADVALPLVLKLAIDDIVVLGGAIPVLWIGIVYLVLSLLLAGYRYAWRRYFFGASHELANGIRADLFAHLERLDQGFFDTHRTGDLMSRATNDIEAVRWFASLGLLLGLDTLMYLLLIPPTMIALSPTLTGLALLPLLPTPFIVRRLGRVIHERYGKVQESLGQLTAAAEETIGGIRVVKGFSAQPYFLERFHRLNDRYRAENMRLQLVHGTLQPLMSVFMGIAVAVVFAVGGRMALSGTISVGDFVAFHMYLLKLGWPMRAIGFVVNLYQRGTASLSRLVSVFERKPTIQDTPGLEPMPKPVRGELRFERLTFRYPGAERSALDDVCLTIPAGSSVALVGPVGAGKSTLLELIVRLYDPPPETVFLDGRCVRRYPVAALRGAIGYVPQETFLFADSVRNNVLLGVEGITDERLHEVLARARILDDVLALPKGLDTELGERGVDLSGGQRQRLAIARALVRSPDVLLLDDCLSAVDAETEAAILKGLAEELRGKTALIATHRLASIEGVDHIVCLDEGRVIEQGTHTELLAKDGLYAELWRRQRLERQLEIG